MRGVKRAAVEGRSELCLYTKASPSSTGAGRMERLMHDNEKTSSGTFRKRYSAHLSCPPGLHHVRSRFSHVLCIPAPVLLGFFFCTFGIYKFRP